MASVKKNIVLNGINTVTGILFPMVTFPYAARVLLPEGIGIVNFQASIINYIVILTSLGLPYYAVREIAKYSDDKIKRDKITIEIIILSIILCVFGYLAVWILARYVPQIHQNISLFYILSLNILFNAIGVNWFYQGIEDFKFITIRAIIVRTASALSLFLFVKNQNDIIIYGLISVLASVGNNFINFVHLRKHISVSILVVKKLKIFNHLKPAFHVFILNLIISLYVQLNTVMLGFMKGDDAVGFFTAGTRVSHIGLTIIGSLSTVLLPRCSLLLKKGDSRGFKDIIDKSINLTLAISLPLAIGLIILAPQIISIFCGDEYDPAIMVLIINAPIILIISLSNIVGVQILYPMDKINIVIIGALVGAIANLSMNFLLIPRYSAVGCSISSVVAEIGVLSSQLIIGRKFCPFKISALFNYKYYFSAIVMGILLIPLINYFNTIISIILIPIIGIVVYSTILILLKDQIILNILNPIFKNFKG